ncbi:MAG: amidase [Opitutales bacterium]
MSENITHCAGVELRRQVAEGALSVAEIVDAHLDAIEKRNPALNAYCTIAAERARAQATEADVRLARGASPRPLEGFTVAVKDITETQGIRTTYGSKLYRDYVPSFDNSVVGRLKDAGAILLGKSNTSEFAAGAHATNELFGPTRNPWNTALTAGGSTGGGAAAVSACMATVAEGSDLGGSLRIPASFCGVVGLRPTEGLVPTFPSSAPWDTLQVQGPIARHAEDLVTVLAAIAGHDPRSPVSAPVAYNVLEQINQCESKKLRIAYVDTLSGIRPDSAISKSSEEALQKLAAVGVEVEQVDLDLSDGRDAFIALRGMHMVQHHVDRLEQLDQLGPNLRKNLEQGLRITAKDAALAEKTRASLTARLGKVLERYDAVVTPCMPIEPFPVEQNYPTEINGKPMETYIDWVAQTFLVTLASVPAASVPFGLSSRGLPMGWQLIGARWKDGEVLALAKRIQSVLDIGMPPL